MAVLEFRYPATKRPLWIISMALLAGVRSLAGLSGFADGDQLSRYHIDMRSANPAFNDSTFPAYSVRTGTGEAMTVEGTINRTGILLLCVLATAAWTWSQFFTTRDPAVVGPYILIGALGGFVMAMVTVFKKEWAGITAPIYALLEGLFLGAVSAMLELRFPGIAIQAVALTFGTCICLLLAYRSGLIRATEKFKLGIFAATGGIALIYIVSMVLGLFGVQIPLIFGSSPIGILFSGVVVVIAALNLILDFDFIEQGALRGSPKYMEWYAAFGLMVTLIWLYLEIIRLLSKLRDRR
jgi:uncharacterized YccA/Bax inhibitor family protein